MSRTVMRRLTGATVALALATALAACGDDEKDPEPQAQGSPTQSAEPGKQLPTTWPLTGLERGGEPFPKRPIIVVKLDNTVSSRPQIGLDRADLIVEELVEGGMTRLAAFFYSDMPKRIGPVRSLRATDIGMVKPSGGVLVASGAAKQTLKRMRQEKQPLYFDPDNKRSASLGFVRDLGRQQPYNLFAKTTIVLGHIADLERGSTKIPEPYVAFGESVQWRNAKRGERLSATFSPGRTSTWEFRGGRYVNTNSNADAGGLKPKTVLVMRVRQGDAGYLDAAGNRVPESIIRGTGPMAIFHDGRVLFGTWTKKGATGHIRLKARNKTLRVPPGRMFVELVPDDASGGRLSLG